MSLAQHIHTLTRPHLPDGAKIGDNQRPALLTELRAAVYPGSDGGGGTNGGRPTPINADAVDLLTQIQHDARVDYVEIHGERFRGPVEALLQSHGDLTDEWDAYLERVTLEWIDAIETLLRPAKPRRKLGIECPSCEQRFHGPDRATCLTANCWGPEEEVLHPAQWHVRCEGCGAEWSGDTLRWFVAAVQSQAA